MHRPSAPRRAAAAAFLPALAAGTALGTFAAHQVDPQAAAETAYLALLATVLLATLAAVEAGSFGRGGWGGSGAATAVLAVLAGWVLPAGPGRGAAMLALLVGAVVVAAGRRLAGEGAGGVVAPGGAARPTAPAAESGGDPSGRVAPVAVRSASRGRLLAELGLLLPLALAVQVLVRSHRLLAPEVDARFLAGLVGLPLLAAAAAAFLAARAGRVPALVAAATVALLGPGFTVLGTGALVALAGGEALWRPRGGAPSRAGERWLGAAAVAAGAAAVWAVQPWAAVVVAGALLLVAGPEVADRSRVVATGVPPGAFRGRRHAVRVRESAEPSPGGERRSRRGAAGRRITDGFPWAARGAVALAAAVALVVLPAVEGWLAAAAAASTVVAPLAAVFALAAVSRGSRGSSVAAAAAVLVVLAAARAGAAGAALAAPLAALPLVAGHALGGRPAAARRTLLVPQAVWSAALLATAALAAGYPWLRMRPLGAALHLFGAGAGWAAAGVVAAAGAAAAGLAWGAGRLFAGRRAAGAGASRPVPVNATAVASESRSVAGGGASHPARPTATAAVPAAPESLSAARAEPPLAAARRPAREAATGSTSPRVAAALATLLLAAAVLGAVRLPPERLLVVAGQALDASSPRQALELPPGAVDGSATLAILVESSLAHGVEVTAGAPVATIRFAAQPSTSADALTADAHHLASPDRTAGQRGAVTASPRTPAVPTVAGDRSPLAAPGATDDPPFAAAPSDGPGARPDSGPSRAWTLRAGADTAEWAIRRPDVAAAAAHPAPAPWLARVAAGGFFGLVFRSRAELPVPAGARWLVVERDPGLPAEAVVHLHRLEVRR